MVPYAGWLLTRVVVHEGSTIFSGCLLKPFGIVMYGFTIFIQIRHILPLGSSIPISDDAP